MFKPKLILLSSVSTSLRNLLARGRGRLLISPNAATRVMLALGMKASRCHIHVDMPSSPHPCISNGIVNLELMEVSFSVMHAYC